MMVEDVKSLIAEIIFFALIAIALLIWRKRAKE